MTDTTPYLFVIDYNVDEDIMCETTFIGTEEDAADLIASLRDEGYYDIRVRSYYW